MPETRLLAGEAGPCEAIAFNIYKILLDNSGASTPSDRELGATLMAQRERERERSRNVIFQVYTKALQR